MLVAMKYIVLVQPITLIELNIYNIVVDLLNKLFTDVEFIPSSTIITPPLNAYDWQRGQYYSPKIIKYIHEMFKDTKYDYILCLGDIDAYADGLNFVFGQASPIYRIACVYTRRLKPEFYGQKPDTELYITRIVKELIHEFGHLLGLSHCVNRECVMCFSNSIVDVDRKTPYFCDDCKRRIEGLGIKQVKL